MSAVQKMSYALVALVLSSRALALQPAAAPLDDSLQLRDLVERECTDSCAVCFGPGWIGCPGSDQLCYKPGDAYYTLATCTAPSGSSILSKIVPSSSSTKPLTTSAATTTCAATTVTVTSYTPYTSSTSSKPSTSSVPSSSSVSVSSSTSSKPAVPSTSVSISSSSSFNSSSSSRTYTGTPRGSPSGTPRYTPPPANTGVPSGYVSVPATRLSSSSAVTPTPGRPVTPSRGPTPATPSPVRYTGAAVPLQQGIPALLVGAVAGLAVL